MSFLLIISTYYFSMGFHGNEKCQPRQETTTNMFKVQPNLSPHFQKLNINTICYHSRQFGVVREHF